MTKQVIGIYNTKQEAIQAIKTLKGQGYREENISVIAGHRGDVSQIANETGVSETYAANTDDTVIDIGDVAAVIDGIAAAFGAVTVRTGDGGLVDTLRAAGLPEEQAQQYREAVDRGKILVLTDSHKSNTHR